MVPMSIVKRYGGITQKGQMAAQFSASATSRATTVSFDLVPVGREGHSTIRRQHVAHGDLPLTQGIGRSPFSA